ncbi:MAG: AarF/UbiB family protein, partial [Acidobacteriota bacterium]
MAQRVPSIPQIYRNLARWREILAVLSTFGVAEWLSRLEPGVRRRLVPIGREYAHLGQETRVRLALEQLGPTAIKLGQVLSTRSDLVGVRLAQELERLQTHAPPTPFTEVRATIESELGRSLDELFETFDPTPIASASIGQVHGARLPPSDVGGGEAVAGERVVVKVQHPGIARTVRIDLEILAGVAQLAERLPEFAFYRPTATVNELRRTLLRELDFASEERHLAEFRAMFEDQRGVRVPRPYPELSTHRVLTMERLDGIALRERDQLIASGHDVELVARRGVEAYMEMVFHHGVYHADPHPGNILVLPGNVVGLIDFGMIGRLDEQLREDVEDILLALSMGDGGHLASIIVRVGQVPIDLDHAALDVDIAEFVAHYATQSVGRFDLGGALSDLTELIRRHRIMLPARLSLLIKMLVVLEGSARLLRPDLDLVEVIAGYQRQIVLRRLSPKRRLFKILRLYGEMEHLFEVLPRGIADLLEQAQSGKLDVHLDHRGLEP